MKKIFLKKFINYILLLSLFATSTGSVAFAEGEPEQEAVEQFTVTLLPTDDATIRANMQDINYGTKTNLEMDVREGSRRYGLIRFDASDIKTEADTASKVMFRFYGTNYERCKRLLLYPLYGNHKNFNEKTITWSVATGIKEGGVSLTEYLSNQFETPLPPEEAKWHEIEVTDYVKSQSDYIYSFKTWATPGSTYNSIIRAKEQQSFEPQLVFYTDVDAVISKAVEEIKQSVNLAALTEDVTLPTTWQTGISQSEACDIFWESADESVLKITDGSTGEICARPEITDGTDRETKVTMTVSYRGKVVSEELKVCVLAKNIVGVSEDNFTRTGCYDNRNYFNEQVLYCGNNGIDELSGDAFVRFVFEPAECKRAIFRIYNDNSGKMQSGEISLSKVSVEGSLNEITGCSAQITSEEFCAAVYSDFESYIDFDVTDILDDSGEITFKLSTQKDEWRFFSGESDYGARLIFLDEQSDELYTAAKELTSSVENRQAIENDFLLPVKENLECLWESSPSEFINVSYNTVVVQRPKFTQKDSRAALKLTVTDGISKIVEEIPVNIVKSEADGINGRRYLEDPMKMSDESFFGKWDKSINGWLETPILQYESYSELGRVEAYAKKGHYDRAKEALLEYYRSRDKNLEYEVTPTESASLKTRLAAEDIIGNQSPVSTACVTSELGWYEIDIPVSAGVQASYMLFDRSKDGSTAVFYSHETQYAPYLKVSTNSGNLILPCVADTYMQGMENSRKNYGTENILLVHEEGNPFNKNTQRTFLNFDTSLLDGNTKFKSISLMVYGKKINGKNPEMDIILYEAPLLIYMNENEVTWSDHTPGSFNFAGEVYDWSAPYGSEAEWINLLTRQNDNTPLVSYYLGTGDEEYAAAAIERAMGIYIYQSIDFPRALDTAWRVPNLLAVIFGAMNSIYMTPEVFCALLKYSYAEMNFLRTATASVVNQINAIDIGFSRLVVYFPELRDGSYLEAAISRHNSTFSKSLCHDDGAYREATTGYISGLLSEMKEVIEMFEKIGYEDTSLYREKLIGLTNFFMCCISPENLLVPYGDGGRSSEGVATVRKIAEFLDDDEMRFVSNSYKIGKEPSYTSRLFDKKKICIMRNSWDKNALYSFMNSEYGHSHGHPDNLHMDVYAYGRALLIDAGNGGGYNPISPAEYVRRETYPHNTVEVGDEPQTYDIGTTGLTLSTNKTFDYVEGYTDANDGFRHTRKVFFLRNAFWLVSDIIVPQNPGESTIYRQNWHPDNYANLEIDEVSGKASTHFTGTANIQILQADMSGINAIRKQSYIRSSKLENILEDYVCYEKEQTGTATFNTLLYPTAAGDDDQAEMSRIPTENDDAGSAMELTYKNKRGIFYISNEDEPTQNTFGAFKTDGEAAYVEYKADESRGNISLVDGTVIEENGEALLECSSRIKDISVDYYSDHIEINTSEKLACDLKIKSDSALAVYLNSSPCDFDYDGEYITVKSKSISFPVSLSQTKIQYTLEEDMVKTYTIENRGSKQNVTVTIPAGTTVSSVLGWDGTLDFDISEENGLALKLENSDYAVSFDNAVIIDVPFYSQSGAYYTIKGLRKSFKTPLSEKSASISKNGSGVKVNTMTAGTFYFPVRSDALIASDGGGGGGGGGITPSGSDDKEDSTDNEIKEDNKTSFSDTSGHWAEKDIAFLAEKGIISGYEDGSFKPNGVLTRAELVTMLVRAFIKDAPVYENGFSDVSSDDWFANYVGAAADKKIVSGFPDGSFKPNNTIARQEAALMICKAAQDLGIELKSAEITDFEDRAEVAQWALEYMKLAVGSGIIRGTDSTHIQPQGKLTRAMAASMIRRIINED